MKILWLSPLLPHPILQGGQIRSLGILKKLHAWHEVHFASMWQPGQSEGRARTGEYCTKAYLVEHCPPPARSLEFMRSAVGNLVSPLPLTIARDISPQMRALISQLQSDESFDVTVCDFLHSAVNTERRAGLVLFQHNVETMIWRRMSEHAATPLHRWYFGRQADRMYRFERSVCRTVGHVIAVSENDAKLMRDMYDLEDVTAIATGVDLEYFQPPAEAPPAKHDLVFFGSMNWMANVDGILWFTSQVLPLIRRQRPQCTLALVGRDPAPQIVRLGEQDPFITVTGTVEDIRPYLWSSRVAIVPLRVGGGTRIKIYEAMAAKLPQVSTTIGAEGLDVNPGRNIEIADEPEEFAARCLELLDNAEARRRRTEAARRLVEEKFSWEHVARQFEGILTRVAAARTA